METKELTLKQQEFCKYYIENKGNGTKSYMKAFSTEKYDTAKVEASRLLTNPNISKKINEILKENWFNDISIDLELLKVIKQDDNLYAKLRAIVEYNKLKNRYNDWEFSNLFSDIKVILPVLN